MRNKLDKLWGLLFLAVPVYCVGIFVVAPQNNWWFPDDVSAKGFELDNLFYMILAITGIAFVITQGILVFSVFTYAGRVHGHKAAFIHSHHGIEVGGAVLVSVILLLVALVQIGDWEQRKYWNAENQAALKNDNAVTIGVQARQFEWRITYPGKDGKLGTPDDIHGLNKLHIPADRPVLIKLTSADVLHSFFLPNFRVKQDAVPGMEINVWFQAKGDLKSSSQPWDLVCAELCGWGHYKMKGAVIVHPDAPNAGLAVEVTAVEASVETYSEELTDLEETLTTRTEELSDLEKTLKTRIKEISELEKTLSELDDGSETAAQRQKLESDRDESEAQRQKLESDLDEAEAKRQKVESDRDIARTNLSVKKKELALIEVRLRLGMDKTWETWLEEAWVAQEATTLE